METNSTKSRTAIVTGAGRGIGEAIAVALAESGHNVVAADLDLAAAEGVAAAISERGLKATPLRLDVASPESVRAGVERASEFFGGLDIVVNNAGWDELMPFVESGEELWRRVVDINYLGPVRVTHAVLPRLLEQGWGRVINIGSDAGRVGSSLEAVYSGAKGGVIAFTKTLAREVARKGITANTVCPGPTKTPLIDEVVEGKDDADAVIASMVRAVPMKRLGQPADIAAAVCYFATEEAAFVTGQTLSVSGGLTMA